MVFHRALFRKVTIIGVGLMGGSIGMSIKKNRLARQVVGFSQRQESLNVASQNKAIDMASNDIKQSVHNADLVILSTPVNTIIHMLPIIAPHLKKGCIVTDVGSTKAMIVETAERCLSSAFFVGSHPLAGSEKRGATHASADLFEDSMCILTPTKKTNRSAKDKVQTFWKKLGAQTKVLSPSEHDQILAYISHLPHVLAYGLMGAIPKDFLKYAAQGLKDTTRIASSSPQMWSDICMANSRAILKSLDELVDHFSIMRKAITCKDEQTLVEYFKKAKEKRDVIG